MEAVQEFLRTYWLYLAIGAVVIIDLATPWGPTDEGDDDDS